MTRKVLLATFLWLFSYSIATADPMAFYDFNMTYPLITKDPDNLHGYRFAAGYQPRALNWDKVRIYFDLGLGHWWIPGATTNSSINIISVAPILRAYFIKNRICSPFIELSVGSSYLSRTRIGNRNLGIHFSFQDQISVGTSFGQHQEWAVSLTALHYSNASLSVHNSGITVPLLINLSYLF
jgi:lipid A 3-O-deacylase